MDNFIPALHLNYTAEQKLKPEWWKAVINTYYYNNNLMPVLGDRTPDEIRDIIGYSTGKYSMQEYKDLFKPKTKDSYNKAGKIRDEDISDVLYERVPLIPSKVNTAVGILHNVPIDINVKANDPLAFQDKAEDMAFLRNKPRFQEEVDEMTNAMGMDRIPLGTTSHSDIPYDSLPYGLDIEDPEDNGVFADLIYSLGVETSYEIMLTHLYNAKRTNDLRLLMARDLVRYAVCCSYAYENKTTGLVEWKYINPAKAFTYKSELPDHSDSPVIILRDECTVTELYERFGNEIGSLDDLEELINGENGYVKQYDNRQRIDDFNTYKVLLSYIEVKTVDWVGIKPTRPKSRFNELSNDEDVSVKRWAQNTYGCWWLTNTNKFFGIHRLPWAFREKGKEYLQGFSININKAGDLSIVEAAIPFNRDAQRSYIKMRNAIVKAREKGMYIDLKYIRNAILMSKKQPGMGLTGEKIITAALMHNQFIGDTEGFDGRNEGNYVPFRQIEGGFDLREISGYLQIILDAQDRISRLTGINDQMGGESGNKLGLVGMQQLLVSAGINKLHEISYALENNISRMVGVWAAMLTDLLKDKKTKEYFEGIIGREKVELVKFLKDVPVHRFGVEVSLVSQIESIQKYAVELERAKQQGVVTPVEDYILSSLKNVKQQRAFLASVYRKFERKRERERMQLMEQQQVVEKTRGDNMERKEAARGQAEISKVAAQGQVASNLLDKSAQLNAQTMQFGNELDLSKQRDRSQSQLEKELAKLREKYNLDRQKAVPISQLEDAETE